MKAFAKILIISACFVLVGAIIAGVGVALGAKGFVFDRGGKLITVKGEGVGSYVEASEKLEAFSEATIDVKCGKVIVEAGNEYSIEIKYSAEELKPTYAVKNGKLEVTSPNGGFFLNFGMFDFDKNYVKVIVPSDALKNLSVDSSAGEVDISGLTGTSDGTITVRASAGGIDIENVYGFGELNVKSSAGGVDLEGVTVGSAVVKSSAGSIEIKDFEGSLEADSSAGGVEVSLRDGAYSDAKYSVSLKASAGSVEVDGRHIKGSEYSFGSGSKYIIHIKSSAGSVKFDTNR